MSKHVQKTLHIPCCRSPARNHWIDLITLWTLLYNSPKKRYMWFRIRVCARYVCEWDRGRRSFRRNMNVNRFSEISVYCVRLFVTTVSTLCFYCDQTLQVMKFFMKACRDALKCVFVSLSFCFLYFTVIHQVGLLFTRWDVWLIE